MKYVDFPKCIPVSWDKNINFEEVRWYQKIYACFTLWKYQFWWSRCFSTNVYLIQVIQISILMKYGDFQKCIPVSWDKNINFEEVRWYQKIYACFTLWKYQFWWSRCFSRNVYLILGYTNIYQVISWSMLISRNEYLFHGIKILILKKYVDFQKCIPVSGYKNINFDEVVVFFQKCIPDSSYTNIYFHEVCWFPEMNTCFTGSKYPFWRSTLISRNVFMFQVLKISILMKYVDFQNCIHVSGL